MYFSKCVLDRISPAALRELLRASQDYERTRRHYGTLLSNESRVAGSFLSHLVAERCDGATGGTRA